MAAASVCLAASPTNRSLDQDDVTVSMTSRWPAVLQPHEACPMTSAQSGARLLPCFVYLVPLRPWKSACVWTTRTLIRQRTSSLVFRRLSVRLPPHSCHDRPTTRYFWWPSCPRASACNAIRSQAFLWLGYRIGSPPGFKLTRLGPRGIVLGSGSPCGRKHLASQQVCPVAATY